MSRRNPASRSASSPKVEDETLLFFSWCWTPRKDLYRSSRHLKPISLTKNVHQVLKPKKIGTWEVTDIAKRRAKHQPFRHCISRFFTSDDDLQCALYSTLYSGRFHRKFCESRRKVSTIPYRSVRMISRARAQRTRSWNCDWDRSALQSSARVSWTVNTRSSLASENNGTNRSDTFLYDQSFRSQRWARFLLTVAILNVGVFLSHGCHSWYYWNSSLSQKPMLLMLLVVVFVVSMVVVATVSSSSLWISFLFFHQCTVSPWVLFVSEHSVISLSDYGMYRYIEHCSSQGKQPFPSCTWYISNYTYVCVLLETCCSRLPVGLIIPVLSCSYCRGETKYPVTLLEACSDFVTMMCRPLSACRDTATVLALLVCEGLYLHVGTPPRSKHDAAL